MCVQFIEVLELHPGTFVNLCSLVTPVAENTGRGEHQPPPNASCDTFLNVTFHAARKTPNLPISCSACILEREHGLEGVSVCCCPCCQLYGRCCVLTGCWALQRHRMASGAVPGAVCKQGGAQGHLASSIAQRQPGSRAGHTWLCVCSRSLAWSLHLASWPEQHCKAVSCACWPWDRAGRAQPAAEAEPVLLTHHYPGLTY